MPNPAAEKTIVVGGVAVGAVDRVRASSLDPRGKGINVSRMLHRLGCAAIALGFLGGGVGRRVARALRDEGVQHRFILVPGQTRLNVTVRAPQDRLRRWRTAARWRGACGHQGA